MPRGEKNKLTQADIQEIIELKDIIPAHKVALQFSISPAMVYKIWDDISYYKDKYGLVHQLDLAILHKMILTLEDSSISFPFTPREIKRYSELQKQAVEQRLLNDIYPPPNLSLIFFGMSGCGKTSVLRALRGEAPQSILTDPPVSTSDFEKGKLSFQGLTYEVYDMTGFVPFLRKVLEGNPEYLFREGRAIIFFIDVLNSDQLLLSKFYLEQAVNNITYFVPNDNLPLGVLLHKVDLLDEEEKDSKLAKIKALLTKNTIYPINFYETSLTDIIGLENALADIIK